jgi:type IV secretion system protein VirD4
MAQNKGYAVRVFNLVNMESSDRWNPIEEVKTDLDAYLLSQVIIENTEGARHRPIGDKFWERSEQNLLIALILYIAHEASPENRNLAGLYDLLTNGSFDELDATFKSLPDGHPAKRPYNLFCMTERKNQGNIIQGLGTRLKVIQTDAVQET